MDKIRSSWLDKIGGRYFLLTKKEKEIVRLRLGGLTYRAIGAMFKLSRQRAYQICNQKLGVKYARKL